MSWKGDPNAIHSVIDGEIDALTEKASPVDADLVLIEDSADSNAKKKAQLGNLPGGGGSGVGAADSLTLAGEVTDATNLNGPHDVQVADGYAYVACKGSGSDGRVTVVDITDPTTPAVVTSRAFTEDIQAVLVAGRVLYVGGESSIYAVDITDRSDLTTTLDSITSGMSGVGEVNGMAFYRDHIFLAGKDGVLAAIDVSDPTALSLLGTFTATGITQSHDVYVHNNHLFVCDQLGTAGNEIIAISFTDSNGDVQATGSWTEVGGLSHADLEGGNRLTAKGGWLFVACGASNDTKLAMVDIEDPANMSLVDSVTTTGGVQADGIALMGDYILLGDHKSIRLYTYTAGTLTLVDSYTDSGLTGTDSMHDLEPYGDYVVGTAQNDDTLIVIQLGSQPDVTGLRVGSVHSSKIHVDETAYIGELHVAKGVTIAGVPVGQVGGGASSLNDLSDVSVSSPAANEALRYDGSEWVNTSRIWKPLLDSDGAIVTDDDGDPTMGLAPQ